MTPVTPRFPAIFPMASSHMLLDMAKRAGRGGSGSGRVNRVTGQNGSFLNGSIGLRVKRVAGCASGQVDPYFSKKNFFFFLSRCNLPSVYEFLNYN